MPLIASGFCYNTAETWTRLRNGFEPLRMAGQGHVTFADATKLR